MIRTLEKRIVLFTLLALTVAIVANTAFNLQSYRQDYRNSLILRSHSVGASLKSSIEKVLGFGIDLQDVSGINERCALLAESDPAISYVLVEDVSGKVVFGSDSFKDYASDQAHLRKVEKDRVVLGFSTFGDFYDIQQPFYDASSELAGRIRIGIPVQVVADKTSSMIQRAIVILIGAFALAVVMIVVFVKRDVIRPLRQLENVATQISGGQFDVSIPQQVTLEFEQLGRSLREMARSLKERDSEIHQNYLVLEESNAQLRDSYEQQELIGHELVRSREMYRLLLDDASDAIIVSDDENRIMMINKAAESLFAISRQRAEGQPLVDFLADLNVDEAGGIANLYMTVLHGQTLETEIRFVRPSDKSALIGWAKCSPIVDREGKRIVQTIVRDVTREREVTMNLEKSASELERLNEMKDSFLGVASHELKTPLTVILGYTELLLGEMSPLVGAQALPMIEHISRSAERLSTIVRDMVDVTLLDNQNIRLRCQKVEVRKLLDSVTGQMDYFFRRRNQSLVLDLADNVTELWCDEERINQVLTNLISNAIKFTPDNGTITIKTRRVNDYPAIDRTAVSEQTTPEDEGTREKIPYIEISIRDTGIGIAEKDQQHIFDKFYEVGEIGGHFTARSAFKGKGTGLGLSIAKGFVDLHHGVLRVESSGYDPEQLPGSTFVVLLPDVVKSADLHSYKLS